MKKEDLIKKIQELPDGCEIGTIDISNLQIESMIEILTNKDKVPFYGEERTIESIENARLSNADYICDYYIY